MQQTTPPNSEQVGLLYDSSPEITHCGAVGGNIHSGYWPDTEPGSDDDSMNDAQNRLTDLLISKLRVRSGMRVLDLGCGVGVPTLRLARATGAEVVGITISREQVTKATATAEAQNMANRVSFQHADALNLPFPDESFDAVFALESIVHMPERGRVFREIQRVLSRGGQVVLTDLLARAPIPPDKKHLADTWFNAWMLAEPLGSAEYVRLMQDAGLRVAEFLDIGDETIRPSFRQAPGQDGGDRHAGDTEDPFNTPELSDVHQLSYLLAVGLRLA